MRKEKKIVIRFLGLLLSGILTRNGTEFDAEPALQVLIREVKQTTKENCNYDSAKG